MTQTKRTDDSYDAEALHQFAQRVFEKLGLRSADADILADHLVWADLRGITWLGLRKAPSPHCAEARTRSSRSPVCLPMVPGMFLQMQRTAGWSHSPRLRPFARYVGAWCPAVPGAV